MVRRKLASRLAKGCGSGRSHKTKGEEMGSTVRLILSERDQGRLAKIMKRHNISTKTGAVRAALWAYAKHLGIAVVPARKKSFVEES